MAQGYGITGWSGGTRVPLTYNLKAGQLRGARGINVFPSNTVINNYGCNHMSGCYDDGASSDMPKWMQWLMGFGFGSQLLGGVFSMFCGGGGPRASKSAESDNKGVLSAADTQTLAGLRSDFGDYVKIGDPYGDGSITVKDKETGAMTRYADLNAVKIALESKYANKASDGNNPSNKNAEVVETGMKRYVSEKSNGGKDPHNIICEYKNGKYELKYTDDDGKRQTYVCDEETEFKHAVDNVIDHGSHVDKKDGNASAVVDKNSSTSGKVDEKEVTADKDSDKTIDNDNGVDDGNVSVDNSGIPKPEDIDNFKSKYDASALVGLDIAVDNGIIKISGKTANNKDIDISATSWENAESKLEELDPSIKQKQESTTSDPDADQKQDNSNNQSTTIKITTGSGVIDAINNVLSKSSKKITPAKAQAVMNLLITDNSGVTSELNGKTLNKFYTGTSTVGSKGNYGFVVQPGQTITIPSNVWAEIEKLAQ